MRVYFYEINRKKMLLSFGQDNNDNCMLIRANAPSIGWHTVRITSETKVYVDEIEHNTMLYVPWCRETTGHLILGQDQDGNGAKFDANQSPKLKFDYFYVIDRIASSDDCVPEYYAKFDFNDESKQGIASSGYSWTEPFQIIGCTWESGGNSNCPDKQVKATASSVWLNYVPQFAIDSKFSYENKGFFHSEQQRTPWFKAELSRTITLIGVRVHNRRDCCGDRLNNIMVRAGTTRLQDNYAGIITQNIFCGNFTGPGVQSEAYVITCQSPIPANVITLQIVKSGDQILQLDEVEFITGASYNLTQGACRNQNGKYNDIFSDLLTLDKCKTKCGNTVGCGAVSYNEVTLDCYGRSMTATTTPVGAWKCYTKTG